MRLRTILVLLLALAVAGSAAYLQWRPRPVADVPEREATVPVTPPPSVLPTPPPPPPAPPGLGEVQDALDRAFAQSVAVDPHARPAFVAGDFNGDEVADMAAVVRPRGGQAAARINAELHSCARQDAAAPGGGTRPPGPAEVGAGDALLAVLHGAGPAAWRSTDGLSCFLVKNAAGGSLRVRALERLPAPVRMTVMRPHAGDVIVVDRQRAPGVVLWTGAAYAWAPDERR
jgi:hypothetical protein